MKALCLRYLAWFGALKPRERNMVVMAALALAGFIPYTLILDPALRESRRLTTQLENQSRTLATIQTDMAALAKANVDPDQVSRERVTDLTRQLRSLDEAMRRSQKGLVPADQMAKMLETLLDRNRGLRVVALRNLPPAPFPDRPPTLPTPPAQSDAAPANAKAAPDAAAGSGVYRHGVELVLQGSYAELSAYLEQIERLPTQMFWSSAVLDAENYPRVTLTLSIFTIGLEAAWLSV